MTVDHPTLGLIRDVVRFLSRDPLGVEDIAVRIGPVAHDPGGLMPVELRPTLPGLSSARLARYPESGLPYVLDLGFAPDARPTAAALRGLLGDYRRALTDRGRPPELVFYPPAEGGRWRVVVIARLDSAAGALETTPITSIAFRRDPVVA